MSESYDFPKAEIFWPGAEGPPGKRVFFLAGGSDGEAVYLRCEKQQVAALGEYLLALLEDLSPDVEPEERIVVVLEELSAEGGKPATARFCFTLAQAAAFARFALDLVAQGRPDCGFCGQPIDAEGHVCPRMN